MKILFITDHIYKSGGIERVLSLKANYMAQVFNWEISILTIEQMAKPSFYELAPEIKLYDIGINYNRKISYFSLENLLKVPKHIKRKRDIIRQINPDFIISVSYGLDFYWLPFICKKTKKLKEFHSSRYYDYYGKDTKTFKNKWKLKIRGFIESKFERLIILNPDEKKYYNNKNISIIPNPAPETDIYKAQLIDKKAMAAGRIAPVKGFDKLISIWKLVVAKHPEWTLDIFGEDYLDTAKELKNQIKANGLENSVYLKKAIPNIPEEMQNYSLYLMTSKTECFPMVLLEAMSVGLPVVSFDCPTGPRNILLDEQAELLIPDQDVELFATQISKLISDPSARIKYGEYAQKVAEKFGLSEIMNMWKDTLITES